MKFKVLGLFVLLCFGSLSYANSVIERKIRPTKSAIQSTNVVFKDSTMNENLGTYNRAINELQNKIKKYPNDYVLYTGLIDLYMKTKQYSKAHEELVFLNNLSKKNKLGSDVLKSLSEVLKHHSMTGRYYRTPDIPVNLSLMNLILQNNSQAETYLLMGQNSKLFTSAYKEVFDTTANYPGAIALAEKILNVNSTNLNLRKLKAHYLTQLNRVNEAINEYSKVIVKNPEDIESKYFLYNLMVSLDKQEKDIMKALYPNDNSGYEKAYSELSDILLKKNDVQWAKYYAEKLVKKFPDNANGYILLSEIYRREGKLQESYDVLKVVRDKADNNDAISKYNVMLAKLSDKPVKEADSLMNNGLYSQALNVLEEANQESLYVILGMARANYFLENKQKALELLNKAMSLYPKNADVFYYFAYIFYKENDIESARNYLAKALEIMPNHNYSQQLVDVLNKVDSDKYVSQIISSFEAQNYSETMRLINEAMTINKKDSGLYYYQGLTYIAMNNYSGATAPLYKALELDKNNVPAYFYLALAFDNLSESKNALNYYKKFIQLFPADDYGESEKLNYAKNRIEKLSK